MRKQDKVVIWPAYFDANLTRDKGRKVPKFLSVSNPKITELKEAADLLRLKYEMMSDASYPKAPWLKTGKLLVAKKGAKTKLLKQMAAQLQRLRASTSGKR